MPTLYVCPFPATVILGRCVVVGAWTEQFFNWIGGFSSVHGVCDLLAPNTLKVIRRGVFRYKDRVPFGGGCPAPIPKDRVVKIC